MPSQPKKTIQILLTAFVAMTAFSCSAESEESGGDVFTTPAPVRSIPAIKDTDGVTLPVETYLFTPEQEAQVTHATGILIAQCMRDLGFTSYPMPSPPKPNHREHTFRRYGVTDERTASTWGYHAPPESSSSGSVIRTPTTESERLALSGGWDDKPRQLGGVAPTHIKPSAQVNGKAVPTGGCSGEAERQLKDGRNDVGVSLIAQQIDQSYDRSLADSRVIKVFGKWSACMVEKGFTYKSVLDAANDKRWAGDGEVTKAETSTALADVACKQQHNVVGVWSSVEAAFQKTAIEKNHVKLKAEQDRMDATLQKAAKIIAAG